MPYIHRAGRTAGEVSHARPAPLDGCRRDVYSAPDREAARSKSVLLRLGHSPDPDDAFMFYALAEGLVEREGLEFEHVLQDIETLNRRAEKGELEITALSAHAYAFLHDRYLLLPHGASMGDGYGPLLVSRRPMRVEDLKEARIAVPGTRTSAFLAARLALGYFQHVQVPFDRIMEFVQAGEADAGLLIHEGQLTYAGHDLNKVLDLGAWWQETTGGLPLPLGVNAVRRDLSEPVVQKIVRVLGRSIDYGLRHREPAVAYALRYGRGLDRALADRFIGMYVNDLTRDLGERGRAGLQEFLRRGHAAGLVPAPVPVEFATA
ncbi:MAG TPA: MqnA/MqnD/SBP family protein [Candidatus Krumholzibacteria bacterium]|nr:MqnA/MqnD/SBP family protein [Candidatus Krumholzibacteria bacterium]